MLYSWKNLPDVGNNYLPASWDTQGHVMLQFSLKSIQPITFTDFGFVMSFPFPVADTECTSRPLHKAGSEVIYIIHMATPSDSTKALVTISKAGDSLREHFLLMGTYI